MSIIDKLALIQSALKVPKGQYNNYGNYKYRSCEDILEVAKPICLEYGVVLVMRDDVVNIGDRFYIKAEAILTDAETGETFVNTAYAREEEKRTGMDGCQITGTASSYARKYCLNGLFCIDDTKDSDTNENYEERQKRMAREKDKQGNDNNNTPKPSKEELKIPQGKSNQEPAESAYINDLKCSNCGGKIAENVYKYSTIRYKQPLCYKCQEAFKKG